MGIFFIHLATKMKNMRNVLKRIFEFMRFFARFLVFEIWSILYFTFVMHSGLDGNLNKIAGGASPPTPPAGATPLDPACFWIEDPSRNRLASMAYFAKPDFQVFAYLPIFF